MKRNTAAKSAAQWTRHNGAVRKYRTRELALAAVVLPADNPAPRHRGARAVDVPAIDAIRRPVGSLPRVLADWR